MGDVIRSGVSLQVVLAAEESIIHCTCNVMYTIP